MAKATHAAHPIQTLRETAISLQASIRACLAHPGKAEVHQLRTATRRIEAQLELLSLLPGLPPHRPQKLAALALLKRVRRAAAQVRDVDVQLGLLREKAPAEIGDPGAAHRKELRRLRLALKRKRDEHAGSLRRLLRKHQTDVLLIFDELLSALEPAESLALTEADLIALVRTWYTDHHPLASASADPIALHKIRKRAKLARYLAESAPQSATRARRLAARFEQLQQAGGTWHDWLLLAQLATRKLGESSELAQLLSENATHTLTAYQRQLTRKIA